MFKKIVSILLVALLFVAIIPVFPVMAIDTPNFSLSSTTAARGEIVSVDFSVSGLTEGLMYIDCDILFDRDRLEYIDGSVQNGSVNTMDVMEPVVVTEVKAPTTDDSVIIPSGGEDEEKEPATPVEVKNYSSIAISQYGSDNGISKCISGDGVAFTLKFRVKDQASGDAEIKVDSNTMLVYSKSMTQLSYTLSAGAISISIPAESIAFDSEAISIPLNSTYSVIYKVLPEESTDKVSWVSSNTDVAEVNGGMVTAKALGETTITATTDSGKSTYCKITVVPLTDSMLTADTVHLISEGTTVYTKVQLVIPGPYPNKWTAYSNDHYIFVTEGKSYEVAQIADSATEVQEFTVMCVPDQLQAGTYSGSITIICGNIRQKLYVSFELTKDVNYVNYWDDVVFPENKYRVNIAPNGVASASTTLKTGEVCYEVSAIDGCTSYWPRWTSVGGVWEKPESGIERTIHWFMVDLKEQKSFDKFIMYFSDYEWSFLKEFKFIASNDSSLPDDQWYEIDHITENHQRYVTLDFDPLTFRYVKCICIDSAQSHIYGNAARIAEWKILTTTDYPEVEVATGPQVINMKVDATEGIDAIATAPTDAFASLDTSIVIKAVDTFSDEYLEATEKLEKILGYPPIFTMNDIYAYDTSVQVKAGILNGRKVKLKVSVPGGFDFEKTKVLKVLPNGSFEKVPAELETIIVNEFDEITYLVFETDYFGKYIFVEDKYDAFGGGNPISSDIDIMSFVSLLTVVGIFLSICVAKRSKYFFE